MSPRAYHLGKRQAAVDETKLRIISAAYALLTAPEGATVFSMEAVAKKAGVARMTVYYQFGSRRELLEDLLDYIAEKGGIAAMARIFASGEGLPPGVDIECRPMLQGIAEAAATPGPRSALEALGGFIRVLAAFYDSDRMVMRRLRGIAAMDPEFNAVMEERNGRRRFGLKTLMQRLMNEGWTPQQPMETLEDLVFTFTSFETFDSLATEPRDRETVCAMIEELVCQVLGVSRSESGAMDGLRPSGLPQ